MSASSSSRPPAPVASTRQQLDELDALLQRMLELPVNQLDTDTPRPLPARPAPTPTPAPSSTPSEARPAAVAEEPEPEPELPAEPVQPSLVPRKGEDRGSPYMVVATVGPHVQPPSGMLQNPISPLSLGPRLRQPPTVPEGERPAEPAAATETPAKPAAGDSAEGWVPLRSSWQPSAHSWQPLAESWQQRKLPEPVPAPETEQAPAARPESPVPEHTPELARDPITSNALTPLPLHAPAPEQMAVLPPPTVSVQDLEPPPSWLLSALRALDQGYETCLAPCGAPGRFFASFSGRMLLAGVGALCLAAAAALIVADRIGWTW